MSDSQKLLFFLKSGYLLRGYVPTAEGVDYESEVIKVCKGYERRVQRVFGTIRFGSSDVYRNSFVLISGGGGDGEGLWVAKVVLLFSKKLEEKDDDRKFAFVLYMEVTPPIDAVDEALKFIYLRWSTHDDVDYNVKHLSSKMIRERLRVEEWFGIEHLETLRAAWALLDLIMRLSLSRLRFRDLLDVSI